MINFMQNIFFFFQLWAQCTVDYICEVIKKYPMLFWTYAVIDSVFRIAWIATFFLK